MDLSNVQSLGYSWPEIILALGAVSVLMLDLVVSRKERLGELSMLIVGLACLASGLLAGEAGWLFNRMVVVDSFAVFFKIVLGLAALSTIFLSLGSKELEGQHPGEYFSIVLACTLGMFYMASASNLLMAYLALEFVSQTSYILAGFLRHSQRSSEAALKYLIYGGVASGVMLYGISLIFGITGSLDYAIVGDALMAAEVEGPLLLIAVMLTLVGFGYKIAMVPFHMWSPDVYEGAPLPVTAYLSVGSKAAGIALMVRFFYGSLSQSMGDGTFATLPSVDWPTLVSVAAMVTMTVGNLTALRQTNVKRLLAYSSIAHAGYLMMGFVALSNSGLSAMLFYLVVYYLMNMGAFAVLLMVLNNSGREDIEAFRGLAWRGGALPAAAMLVFLFSLAGLPPFAGFIGKMYLFAAVVEQEMWLLALVAAGNSVIGLYYYARIARAMYLDEPLEGDPEMVADNYNSAFAGALVVLTVLFGVYWSPVINFADQSLVFFRG